MEWTPRPLVEHLREQERHNVTVITVGSKYEVYVRSPAPSHMQTLEQLFRTLAIKWEVNTLLKKSSCVFLHASFLHASVFIMVSLWCCRWLYNICALFKNAFVCVCVRVCLRIFICIYVCVCMCVLFLSRIYLLVCINQPLPPLSGFGTSLIIKRKITGLNSLFSFS